MYKYLVVGCGGSGGATVAYLMDQIRSEFAARGIDRIPGGFQFVHIDVPVVEEAGPGMGNVATQGGTYIGTAPANGSFATLDAALTSLLTPGGNLQHTATWAPRRASEIAVPIADGAGQMRAVGRLLTLSHASQVYRGLSNAADALNTVEATTEMTQLARALPEVGNFDPAASLVTIVVSSMAGGAGASMALDVCRLLAHVPQVDPNRTAVFMVAPDVFGGLPGHARNGVLANALAMLGEIVAEQTGAAAAHDRDLLRALGLNLAPLETPPFKRVFPVGRFSGTNRTLFGDGTANAVYRGLGRGLAALMLSGKASTEFVAYDMTNPGPPAKRSVFGWGAPSEDLPWGAFGFGSLSLGRDRYQHYAAQRLARSAVDRLVGGHLQPGSTTSSSEQLRVLLESQWAGAAARMGLPSQSGTLGIPEVATWMRTDGLPLETVNNDVRGILDETVRPNLPVLSGGVQAWLGTLSTALAAQSGILRKRTEEAAYAWSYGWAQRLHAAVLAEVEHSVARFGLPYARALVERVEATITNALIRRLKDLSNADVPDIGRVPSDFSSEAGRIRGAVANGQQLQERLVAQMGNLLARLRYGRSADWAQRVLEAFIPEVLAPLKQSLSDALEVLAVATRPTPGVQAGLANVETDRYAAWPSDSDTTVPTRFGVADNEVLLTPFEGFSDTYREHLPVAVGTGGAPEVITFSDARNAATQQVISGDWPVAEGSSAPGGLLEVVSRWNAGVFTQVPGSTAPLLPSHARYAWRLRPAEILERAEAYVQRPGESFQRYCSQSLGAYVAASDATPAQAAQRREDLVDRFSEAITRALPLIAVDSSAVRAMHGGDIEYFFKFSAIPFADDPEIVSALTSKLSAMPMLAGEITGSHGVFERALVSAQQSQVTRIDIFGSYRNYSPVVFSALLRPVAEAWAALEEFARGPFWRHRRARPLAASLPMTIAERRAMIGGWYVGQLTGRVAIPDSPYDQPVRIWDDEAREWVDFPSPLLTPPSSFLGQTFDWLPAVLESVLLALSRSLDDPEQSSMRPYRLLRGFWDSTENEPASGLLRLDAQRTLAEWLSSGATPSGRPSRAEGATPEGRFESATAWVTTIRDFASTEYMPAGMDGAVGGGEFSVIDSRRKAAETPIFRDLAPDIRAVTGILLDVLGSAREMDTAPARKSGPDGAFGAF